MTGHPIRGYKFWHYRPIPPSRLGHLESPPMRPHGVLSSLFFVSKRLVCFSLFVAMAGTLIDVAAQRVTILDFSSTTFKPRKHTPKPFPPDKIIGGRCGGMTDGKLTASLISLDRSEYSIGDEFNYTIEVRTVGTETVKVPTVFNVADLEPDNPNVSFGYVAMEIWLSMSEESHPRTLSVPLLRLYGSDEMPWTQIELKPGASIEIRGKAKLKPIAQDAPIDTSRPFFDAPYMGSTEEMPESTVRVATTLWRGDIFYYEGSTHYEYPGGFCPEEMAGSVYENKITLRPSSY